MAIVLVRFIARFIVNWSSTQCHSVHGSPAAVLPCRPVLPSPTRHTHVPHLCAYETVGAATEQDCRTFHSSRRHGEAGGNPSPRTPSARQYPTLRAIFEPLGAGAARGVLVPLIVAVHRSLTMPGLFDAADQYALLLSSSPDSPRASGAPSRCGRSPTRNCWLSSLGWPSG